MILSIDRIASPIGTVLIAADDHALRGLYFSDSDERTLGYLRAQFRDARFVDVDDPLGASACVRAYFGGDLTAFDELPFDTAGTEFQRLVWRTLRSIPPGTTLSYGALAQRIGRSAAASRAVGHANSQNPISIMLPCHRVIGANARLTGYAGGLHRKEWLLRHEGWSAPGGEMALQL